MAKTIFSFQKLYQAYLDCRRHKRKTINALKFEWNLERNLFHLQKELEEKRYKPGRSICFVVSDPSPREIFAASFRDRVVHHLLIKEIGGIGEKSFIFDTFSCRKNKGTHLAIRRLKSSIRKATENYKKKIFYAQLDIAGFFMAIDQNILYSLVKKMIWKQNKSYQWKKEILWLAEIIIFYKPTKNYIIKGDLSLFKLIPPRKSLFCSAANQGLPIGNYSSQFFANLYLNELDQSVKRKLGGKYYFRYVDDMVVLSQSKEKLKQLRDELNKFLEEKLNLQLNLEKTKIQSVDKGIDFLGYLVKPHCFLVRQRVVKRLKNKLSRILELESASGFGEFPNSKILAIINSYYGHFSHACSFNLRKDIYESHLNRMKEKFLPKRDYVFYDLQKKLLGFQKYEC